MESNEAEHLLRQTDRAAATPWTDFPPTPRWYPPAVGVWAGAMVWASTLMHSHRIVAGIGLLALVAVEFGFVGWYRRYRGALPTGVPPAEFRPAMARLLLGALVIAAAAWGCWQVAGRWPAVGLVVVATTVLIGWYERAYATAARAARERLA